ncbi:very short patch repair endonuclease [Actinotalea subterranea]|uniref:very short patch repair endonuclease n=1 Tax=Actinotalea subterranea TaxID=2607497 RepID=UPI001CAA86C8|nr:very short patch repair endonuclease [Actinotalea subterranea]
MSRLPRRDTGPELAARRLLHAAGYRYRVCFPVPGAPRRSIDVAFTRSKVAVFIDGCFWHGCPEHGEVPMANNAWWAAKLAKNAVRDRATNEQLLADGWTVLRFWEHTGAEEVLSRTIAVLRSREMLATAPIICLDEDTRSYRSGNQAPRTIDSHQLML